MFLGHTNMTAATLTTNFAANYTGGNTRVLNRKNVALPNMAPTNPTDPTVFFVDIPFDTPFAVSANRNLLLQVNQRGNSNNNGIFTYPLDAHSGDNSVTRLWGTGGTGTLGNNYGLILCFKSSSGGGGGAVPRLVNSGLPRLGQSYGLDISQAAPNSVGLLFYGFSNSTWMGLPLPFDLAVLGAPGCLIHASGEIIEIFLTNAAGLGSKNNNVPNDPNLCGGVLFNQAWVFDPTANAVGFVATNAGRAVHGN
jgi:hypothetical protein